MTDLVMRRMGVLMEPDPAHPEEVEGVLNPATARGPDGQLYLFARLVGKGNYSRIGIARVVFDARGEPVGVERMGIAIEPETGYETWPDGRGGCEDPRVTFVAPLNQYVMTYTAWSAQGPRIALATSSDLLKWDRIGLARFTEYDGIAMDAIDNKDGVMFPDFIDDPDDRASLAILHRPLFPGTRPEEIVRPDMPTPSAEALQTIWISYWHWDVAAQGTQLSHCRFVANRPLALPEAPWEKLKIGAGTPPVLCRHGWLIVYHGVQEAPGSSAEKRKYLYSAGVMILDRLRPHHVLYRSPEPVMVPALPEELLGTVDGVVFPTGIDRRDDLDDADRFDIYYGMADNRIGVATLTVPADLIDPAQDPRGVTLDFRKMHDR